jgi:hypothetical protein
VNALKENGKLRNSLDRRFSIAPMMDWTIWVESMTKSKRYVVGCRSRRTEDRVSTAFHWTAWSA